MQQLAQNPQHATAATREDSSPAPHSAVQFSLVHTAVVAVGSRLAEAVLAC
jgi:hypothetical protein